MRYVILTLAAVASFAIAGIAIIWCLFDPKGLETEIAKALLSILTASVITQAVAVVIYQYNEAKKAEAEKDSLRGRLLDRLNDAFVKIKGVRRKVRAQADAVDGKNGEKELLIPRNLYQETLEQMNDIQLGLEVISKDVETNSTILEHGDEIFRGVRAMEEYLNGMIDEWEHVHAKFDGDPPTAKTSTIPKFGDLLGDYRTSQFRPLFVHSYYETIEKIRASMSGRKALLWQVRLRPRAANSNS
jgi:hypothetical protein